MLESKAKVREEQVVEEVDRFNQSIGNVLQKGKVKMRLRAVLKSRCVLKKEGQASERRGSF